MSTLRFKVVEEAFKKKAKEVIAPASLTSEYYGKYVFDRQQMSKYLSKETLKKIVDVVDKGETYGQD